MARKSRGRQKVEMVKMAKESNLQVTFSKRRSGLFKKASELCTLCGVEVAIVVFSPGKKVFSFGHPCVESVVERYITRNPPPTSGTMQLIEAHRNATVRELNMQLTQALNQLDAEKKRGEELTQLRKTSQTHCWWQLPVEELNPLQLEQLKAALELLKKNVSFQTEKLLIQSSAAPQYFPGSSSGTGGSSGFNPTNMNMNMNMNVNMNMNMNMMRPPPPPHPQNGFNNPGFGSEFY